ncbi:MULTISPECIES: L-rhamnose mutarotase [unclassified Enterococcus]|uniref:L-rhamnose mutarotase n=1 Tax=unclassified Enterococcus TaxID=2608891 RepID=UPI001552A6A9|nr:MULTISPECIES: L-rhamnose mutarotase [unclassified Enterococcus]MBS7577680.1 L-rhamnose mutarotase [Enterococcus sp. MMGLQ5-2]MBS7584126.1 L-rhamnose mutarotase [Enterococcus sp. MMGLQ5-1]NPD11984.1 L-rhamnose mutarotase [Enterococcus sp. MMGLQ5-1]NPD37513.1 L-rhamnose mutarotase [Enterococcus sp. MMGLQ5-2]
MIKKAFKMTVFPDKHQEYEKRHNELWSEMRQMLEAHGAKSYSIFLDKSTNTLFAYLEIEDEILWRKAADTAINRKWWDYMADLMVTNADKSPVVVDLEKVFEL